MRTVVIGLGGIGSNLAEPLCRLIAHSKREIVSSRIIFIDGKKYREHNRERQRVSDFENKAEASSKALATTFPELEIEAKPHFVDDMNVCALVREGDVVFLGCDNHSTRKLLSRHVSSLSCALLISGGNELYDGNVQIYERKNGKDITPPLTFRHPEIERPKDRNPAELSCDELAKAGERQILAVNLTAASLMLNAFAMWLENDRLPYNEIYFDLKTGNVRPVKNERSLLYQTF